jgi:hypothetical protein
VGRRLGRGQGGPAFSDRGTDMASSGKKKTTMAKRDRENRLRERRELKKAKKDARKLAAQEPDPALGFNGHLNAAGEPPVGDLTGLAGEGELAEPASDLAEEDELAEPAGA